MILGTQVVILFNVIGGHYGPVGRAAARRRNLGVRPGLWGGGRVLLAGILSGLCHRRGHRAAARGTPASSPKSCNGAIRPCALTGIGAYITRLTAEATPPASHSAIGVLCLYVLASTAPMATLY